MSQCLEWEAFMATNKTTLVFDVPIVADQLSICRKRMTLISPGSQGDQLHWAS
jgi:hypothetical protein